MRFAFVNVLGFFALFATGCATPFQGEWLEESAPAGQRLMALKFEAPATVRYGSYNSLERVVDAQSEQSSEYFLFEGDHKAQFGSMVAHVEDNYLFATMGDHTEHRFDKVHGPSIFPPDVTVPDLSKTDDQPSIFARAN
jgi:hypothetical protein